MPKIRKKSLIRENADANTTCDFGDGDISRYTSRFPHTRACARTHTDRYLDYIVRLVEVHNAHLFEVIHLLFTLRTKERLHIYLK